MKKIFIVALLCVVATISKAQTNTFPTTGNVGIGTTSPSHKLEINFNANNYDGISITNASSGATAQVQNRLTNDIGSLNYTGISSSGYTGYVPLVGGQAYFGSYKAPVSIFTQYADPIIFYPNSVESMRITATGNVGIGITNPQNKLDVNGTIHSKSVIIDLLGWPDYVFKKDYQLMPLAQVKSYIDQNQHLPEMPSDEEVEAKGLDVGEMNKLLTKKVEELTLYLIEKDKELNEQKQVNKLQDSRLVSVESQLKLLMNKK